MWSPLLTPGRLILLSGPRPDIRAFLQELAHFAVHEKEGCVLWCDGDHGFNPYDFAELNLARGFAAEEGADRVLVKRCMTPFQWDTVLTKHLEEKLLVTPAALAVAAPFENLYSTDELSDWEREDYIRFSLAHLKGLARRFAVPVVIAVDMRTWAAMHPLLAWAAYAAADARWSVRPSGDGWAADELVAHLGVASADKRQASLSDFAPSGPPALPAPPLPHPQGRGPSPPVPA